MNDTYMLTLPISLTAYLPQSPWFVRDYAGPENPELDARVRSGDYFIMLATNLDTVAAEVSEVSPAVTSMALAKLAEDLTYVQQHYTIIKKNDDRKAS